MLATLTCCTFQGVQMWTATKCSICCGNVHWSVHLCAGDGRMHASGVPIPCAPRAAVVACCAPGSSHAWRVWKVCMAHLKLHTTWHVCWQVRCTFQRCALWNGSASSAVSIGIRAAPAAWRSAPQHFHKYYPLFWRRLCLKAHVEAWPLSNLVG